MSKKPIIRHCRNCEWYHGGWGYDCTVRYKDVLYERLRALICRYYKQKGSEENAVD